jgi:alpha,alpha-trehalase
VKRCDILKISGDAFKAVIFDLDGVVTDTASLHSASWKKMFDDFLEQKGRRENKPYAPFDEKSDYLEHVDGKPRFDGVADFLSSRKIQVPTGDPGDPPDKETLYGLGNRKNEIFTEMLGAGEVKVFDSTIALIKKLRRLNIKTAIISSSKNCRNILEVAGIADLFDARVDGIDSEELGLEGKPQPDIFIQAAKQLSVDPEKAVVVEDAQSGVRAGKRGGFGCVIGVNRTGQAEALRQSGADTVVSDLADISVKEDLVDKPKDVLPLPSALGQLEEIMEKINDFLPVVFLDYDGTLTPIVRRPEDAILCKEARRIVRELANDVPVAVVSGRGLEDVRKKVNVDHLYYAGSHGFEIVGPGGSRISQEFGSEFIPVLDKAEEQLKKEVGPIEGSRLERKKYSIAIHYREVAEKDEDKMTNAVKKVHKSFPKLRKTHGKKVFELQPDLDWDKGKAVRWLLKNAIDLEGKKAFPIYIGDDVTDEDAFGELREDGIGIVVDDGVSRKTGAQYCLQDPDEVHIFLKHLFLSLHEHRTKRDWRLVYEDFDPENEKLRETLCTLGNGYFCTRGAAPESEADDVHYPGTYLAGGYNRLKTEVSGRIVENEDLVNMPNWLALSFRIDAGPWFSLSQADILEYKQILDVRHGVLYRHIRFKDDQDRITLLNERRLVSMVDIHLAGLETTIVAENWSGKIEFRSAIDGKVVNNGVERYKELNHQHLDSLEASVPGHDLLFVKVRTNQSDLRVGVAARTRAFQDCSRLFVDRRTFAQNGYAASVFQVDIEKGELIRIEKIVSIYTSRDPAISECGLEAIEAVKRAGSFETLLNQHRVAWQHLWKRFEFELEAQETEEKLMQIGMIIHLYVFHVLQTTSPNTMSLAMDVGAPARGWHGEAYRGHIFWDEVFIFPMINLRTPEITKTLLGYRYARLDPARKAAAEEGYRGAMYPWQSGSNGREETQELHLNPRSGRWIQDRSHRQRHVSAAIAYNLYQYYQVTGDMEFLVFRGAEMMLEIARFWASIATYNQELDRYEILGVMGPDEYHDGYLGAEEGGLNNNAYTNVMAVWVLRRARELLNLLPLELRDELFDKFDLTSNELMLWQDITKKMRLIFHDDGIISQFEGYEDLQEFDWEAYRKKYGNIQRLDRILEAENDTPNRYKASKQADVLMLFYLLSAEELEEIFKDLGYPFEYETIPKNIDYYISRTSHGSTLSRVVHAWVLTRSDRSGSWNQFTEALKSDVFDIQGGTTPEGIHMGAMAGTVDQLQRGYTGIEVREDILWFNPCLPRELDCLRFRIRYRGRLLEIEIDAKTLKVNGPAVFKDPIRIGFNGKVHELMPGEALYFDLKKKGCNQDDN